MPTELKPKFIWPEYKPAEIENWSRDMVLATWYSLWGLAHCEKAPEHFGKFCVSLIERARVLEFDIYKETGFFEMGKDKK